MKSRVRLSLIIGVAVFGGLLVSPRPCAACSPADPPAEQLTLELESVAIDGVVTPDSSYAGSATFLLADSYGRGVYFIVRRGSESAQGLFE